MGLADTESATTPSRLENFPVTVFGVTMGGYGLALALRAGGFVIAAELAAGAATAILALLLVLLLAKAVRHPAALRAEWAHPVRVAFFPATSISLLLLAAFLQVDAPGVARVVWLAGAVAQATLTLVVISAWIGHRAFGPGHLSPAWFIPAVGNVVAPLGGVPLGYLDASWYFFAVGLAFWIVLLTLVFNRLIFHEPLPERLRPTLVILVAPPAVAFLAWLELGSGSLDAPARLFFSLGLFFAALVAVQLPGLARLPFALSFWALSFPLAAITTASFRFATLSGSSAYRVLGFALLALLVATVVGLLARTMRAIRAGEICRPE